MRKSYSYVVISINIIPFSSQPCHFVGFELLLSTTEDSPLPTACWISWHVYTATPYIPNASNNNKKEEEVEKTTTTTTRKTRRNHSQMYFITCGCGCRVLWIGDTDSVRRLDGANQRDAHRQRYGRAHRECGNVEYPWGGIEAGRWFTSHAHVMWLSLSLSLHMCV